MSLYPKSNKEVIKLLNEHIKPNKAYVFTTTWSVNSFDDLKPKALGRIEQGEPWIRIGPIQLIEYEPDACRYVKIPVASIAKLLFGSIWISPENSEWFITKIKDYT